MEYLEQIQKAVSYIEENLKQEISLATLAKVSGYSQYHFLRVFKYVTGLTPADYIRKRRLSEIAKEMVKGDGFISELAFQYSFNSKENFIRAFKSEHHILPTEYKQAENSLKLYDRFTFNSTDFSVTPKILTLPDINLTLYKSDEDYIPNFWNKYNAKKLSLQLSGGEIVRDYGVCVWNEIDKKHDYYIGIETSDAKGDISGTKNITINSGLYALFSTPPTTHSDFVNTIHKTWRFIHQKWIPQSDFTYSCGYQFECYIEQSRIFSEDIYIPITKR